MQYLITTGNLNIIAHTIEQRDEITADLERKGRRYTVSIRFPCEVSL